MSSSARPWRRSSFSRKATRGVFRRVNARAAVFYHLHSWPLVQRITVLMTRPASCRKNIVLCMTTRVGRRRQRRGDSAAKSFGLICRWWIAGNRQRGGVVGVVDAVRARPFHTCGGGTASVFRQRGNFHYCHGGNSICEIFRVGNLARISSVSLA